MWSRVACVLVLGSVLQASVLLGGCVAVPRHEAPMRHDALATVPGFPASIRWFGTSRQDFEARAPAVLRQVQQAAAGKPVNVLMLSGGGAGGAFGAGALVGLSERGARPQFQVVTGVSAGALIAPLAFLGADWDAELTEAFSGSQTQHLLRTHLMGALIGDSLYEGAPLAQLVERYVTDDLLRAIATESRKGRLLVVATTDLDSEQTVFWNLGLIAEQGGAAARRLFSEVLIASASIPGVFPPVMIHVQQGGRDYEEMHVDGSAMASLFFLPDVAAILPQPLEPLRGGQLYVLINGPIGVSAETTRDQTFSILKRSATATLQGGTRAAIEIADSVAQRHRMSIAVTDIPDDYPFAGSLAFDALRMKQLFDYGEHCALEDELWSTPIDALDQRSSPLLIRQADAVPCAGGSLAPGAGRDRLLATPAGYRTP